MINRVSAILRNIGVRVLNFRMNIGRFCLRCASLREKRSFSWQSISGKAKRVAFSLVEILVALIIVSLITAALAPVITKKLSSAGITIIGGGSSGNTEAQWGEPRSQSDCDPYNALYIPKEWNGGVQAVCVTKYNVGDARGADIATGIKTLVAGDSNSICESVDQGNCCWKGTTTDSCTTSDSFGSTYNGCNRTVCQWQAGKTSCQNWGPVIEGVQVKTWRLPKNNELSAWSDRISSTAGNDGILKEMGSDGLQLCFNLEISQMTRCEAGISKCYGSATHGGTKENICIPDHLYGEGVYASHPNSNLTTNFTIFDFNQEGGNQQYIPKSVRCVTDNVPYPETIGASGSGSPTPVEPSIKTECSSIDSNCQLCTSTQCITCKQGYVMGEDGKCEESDEIIKYVYPNQPKTNGDCEKYNALFISKAFTGSGRNVCMSRYNSGDTDSGYSTSPKGPTIPASIKLTNVGSSCDAVYEKCCWKGATTTSGGCTTPPSGTYSGCNRTVCNHAAAKEICDNYAPSGTNKGDWRLPNTTEMLHIALRVSGYISDKTSYAADDFIQKNASKGLMFCDGNTETEGSALCVPSSTCLGAVSNTCYAYLLWTGDQLEKEYFAFRLQYGNLRGPAGYETSHAFSTRCVYDPPGVPAGETNTGLLISTQCSGFDSKCQMCMGDKCLACKAGYVLNEDNTCTKYEPEVEIVTDKKYLYPNQPKSQADCDPYNAKFIHSAITGHGRNICMSKWNAGDNDNGWSTSPLGPTVPLSVTVVNAGSSCDIQNVPCCWKGQTIASDDCTTSWTNSDSGVTTTYSGCKRTVCNYQAAEEICNNYAPSGTNAGDWRMPTIGELNGIANVIARANVFDGWGLRYGDYLQTGTGSGGLQFCDLHSSTKGAVYCYPGTNSGLCPNAYEKTCRPYALYAQKMSNGYLPYFDLQEGSFMGPRFNVDGDDMAVSVRCVYDPPGLLEEGVEEDIGKGFLVKSECSSVSEHCAFCSGGKCLVCKDGYTLDNGACVSKSRFGEPRYQADCDPYNAVFVDKKFNGDYGKNICVAKYNSGDYYGFKMSNVVGHEIDIKISSGVANQKCTNAYCKWTGYGTANVNFCTNEWGQYNACGRTVSTMQISYDTCAYKPIHAEQYHWRMLDLQIVKAWRENSLNDNEFKKFLGNPNKLAFCITGTSSTNDFFSCPPSIGVCQGSHDNDCYPSRVWVYDHTANKSYFMELFDSGLNYYESPSNLMAASSRCFSDSVPLR